MNLSELSIKRPVFAWMLMAALVVFGGIAFRQLGVSQMPDVDFPVVSISLSLIGAAPEVMETQVVDLVEDAVMEIEGIRTVISNSSQGSANVSVEFELGRNIDVAVQEIQSHIAHVQANLPTGMDPPTVRKKNPEDQPILWLTLTAPPDEPRQKLMMYARNVLFDRFSTINGVGDIALGAYVDANLRVWVSGPKLARYDMTVTDVINTIKAEQVDLPAGRLEGLTEEKNVRLMGEARDPKVFGQMQLIQRGGAPNFRRLQLGKVARVEEGLADIRRMGRLNGKFAVGLGILKQHGSNAVAVAEAVSAKVTELAATLPPGYELSVRNDSTKFIRDTVRELNVTMLLSALLTAVVCFLFLGSWSSTINVLLAIPTAIIGAFIVLRFFGFTLNTFTLLGLSLAIGIVVDDAIMMLENIVRHAELGTPRRQAALDGSREITFAAMAATVAVVAIFLPVIFIKGIVGRYLFHYGITVTAAVLLSLLEALSLTPMRCSRFLAVGGRQGLIERGMHRLMAGLAVAYSYVLRHTLRWPWLTVVVAVLAAIPAIRLGFHLPSEMAPKQDQSEFMLRMKTAVDSSLDLTDGKVKVAEAYLAALPEVKSLYSSVGGGDVVNEAQIFVTLAAKSERKKTQREVMDQVRKDLGGLLKGVKLNATDNSLKGLSSGRGFPVEISVNGPDWTTLGTLVETMMAQMEASGIMIDVNTDYVAGMPEVLVTPDRGRALAHGVSLSEIGTTINAMLGGVILGAGAKYPKDGHKYDIRVRLEGVERASAGDIENLKIRNNRGELIRLGDVATISRKLTPQEIRRIDRQRAITVYADVAAGHAQAEALATVERLGRETLPSGYSVRLVGSAQTFRETFQSLELAMGLGVLIAYMVLASQFNSFVHPLSVLVALPLSLCGAFVALAMTGQTLNIYSIIGLILLMGIVKKNSILLVDFTNHLRRNGRDLKTALLEACPVRLRPILMTSVATVAGALPAALAFGPGAETRIPMAIAIIGGVIVSTVLTLVVVPSVYALLAKLEKRPPGASEDDKPGVDKAPLLPLRA